MEATRRAIDIFEDDDRKGGYIVVDFHKNLREVEWFHVKFNHYKVHVFVTDDLSFTEKIVKVKIDTKKFYKYPIIDYKLSKYGEKKI